MRLAMARTVDKGFVFAADISGYTGFITDAELEHGHDVITNLMHVLEQALTFPVRIVKQEGDALLCVATDRDLSVPALLLDQLENAYVAFRDYLFNMHVATTCTCRACSRAQQLDLKFVVHHGEFVSDASAGRYDIAGPTVILLHRLMKNSAADVIGERGYLMATDAALARWGMPQGFTPHEESHDHFGPVRCGVTGLAGTLEQRRAARDVRVAPEDADFEVSAIVSGTPPLVWDYFFDPARRLQWDTAVKGLSSTANGRGREGVGAKMHCAHGSFQSTGITVDWKPFRYFTQQYETGRAFPPSNTTTFETEPLADGRTRVVHRFKSSGGLMSRLLVRLMRPLIVKQERKEFARLDELLRAHVSAQAGGGDSGG
jgi:uncharacterized protein YndB with AHSA1/START domain/class 3 adenylate cyclase